MPMTHDKWPAKPSRTYVDDVTPYCDGQIWSFDLDDIRAMWPDIQRDAHKYAPLFVTQKPAAAKSLEYLRHTILKRFKGRFANTARQITGPWTTRFHVDYDQGIVYFQHIGRQPCRRKGCTVKAARNNDGYCLDHTP